MALPTASDNPFPSLLITEGTEPTAPAAGKQRLYIDSTTHLLKATNSSGTDRTVEGMSLLQTLTASASSSLDFTTFISSNYDDYMIRGVNVAPATNAAHLYLEVGTGAGPTYDTGNNYEWSRMGYHAGGAANNDQGATGLARICNSMSNNAGYGFASFTAMVTGLQSTTQRKTFHGTSVFVNSTPLHIVSTWDIQWVTTGTAATALRFIMSSGNIASGTIRIYGMAK